MKLFLSQKANISAVKGSQEYTSKLIEVFCNYVRAPQRNIVNVVVVNNSDIASLKLSQVSFYLFIECFLGAFVGEITRK